MSNNSISNKAGRQHIITISINDDNYIYADISNNKKKNIINMSDIDNCVTSSSVNDSIPIKQYNTTNDGVSNTINDTTNIDKKILREKIKMLSKDECSIIFSMIKNNTNKYTENLNGIFINMDYLSNETLIKINTYVNKITLNKLNTNMIVIEDGVSTVNNESNSTPSNIKLSNYEKAIIKRNHYMMEQKTFKNNNTWFVKKDSDDV